MLNGPQVTNLNEIVIDIHTFSFQKIHLKLSSRKCLGLDVTMLAQADGVADGVGVMAVIFCSDEHSEKTFVYVTDWCNIVINRMGKWYKTWQSIGPTTSEVRSIRLLIHYLRGYALAKLCHAYTYIESAYSHLLTADITPYFPMTNSIMVPSYHHYDMCTMRGIMLCVLYLSSMQLQQFDTYPIK